MSNEGIVMSERDFDQWYKDNKDRLHLTDRLAAESVWNHAVEHCKQGEPACYATEADIAQYGKSHMDGFRYLVSQCATGPFTHPLFAHSMPKSEPHPTTDISELVEALTKARAGLSDGLWDYGPGQDEHEQCDLLIDELDIIIAKHTVK